MAKSHTTLRFIIPPGALFVAVLLYQLVLAETALPRDSSSNLNPVETSFPVHSAAPASNASENPAFLSLSNILIASKLTWRLLAVPLAYTVYLPMLIFFPIKYSTSASIYLAKALLQPLYPILAPLFLALKIITSPILVPLLLLYRFGVLVYPLYVFLGAATICGASTGVLARRLGRIIVDLILGVGSQPQTRQVEQKRISPRRESRLRVKTR